MTSRPMDQPGPECESNGKEKADKSDEQSDSRCGDEIAEIGNLLLESADLSAYLILKAHDVIVHSLKLTQEYREFVVDSFFHRFKLEVNFFSGIRIVDAQSFLSFFCFLNQPIFSWISRRRQRP